MDETEYDIDTIIELDSDLSSGPDTGPDLWRESGAGVWMDAGPDMRTERDLWDLLDKYDPENPHQAGPGVELDADLEAEPEAGPQDGGQTEAEEENAKAKAEAEKKASEYERALLATRRKKRQWTLILVAAIAWICVAATFLFVNRIGPLNGGGGGPVEEGDVPPVVEPPASLVMWDTAGAGYKDLLRLIDRQTYDFRQNMEGSVAPGEAGPGLGEGDMPSGSLGPLTDTPLGDITGGENNDGSQGDYSETNEQVKGVREADVLKTDGQYIYAINSKNLFIVKADAGSMELVSKIPQPQAEAKQVYFELYIAGDRLVAIRQGYNPASSGSGDPAMLEGCIDYPTTGNIMDTTVDIFDISDRAAPVRIHTLTQSGDYNSSRMIDGYLYLITTYYNDVRQMDLNEPGTFLPLYACDGQQFLPDEGDIFLPPGTTWPCYSVISGIDAVGAGTFISQKALYGDAGTIYVSTGAVYLAHTIGSEEHSDFGGEFVEYNYWSETALSMLTINAGQVIPHARAFVPGYALNQFSLDEYDGALRIVTTNEKSKWYGFKDVSKTYTDEEWARLPTGETLSANALYTLDSNLKILGSVENLAPGERVYSCRFAGGFAYLVTFRQADPLFSVDISDPALPKVLGALKIPGLSEYMFPYAEGRLFGLGRDADISTGRWLGLKLTMFDSSNPADVKERHTLLVGDEHTISESNHKAILVSADRGLVAFPAEGKYMVYGYDDQAGFSLIADMLVETGSPGWVEIRGLFIGGAFYMVGPNRINAYAINNGFSEAGNVVVDDMADSVSRWQYITPIAPPALDDLLIDEALPDGMPDGMPDEMSADGGAEDGLDEGGADDGGPEEGGPAEGEPIAAFE